jgi:hypothetical protein
LVLQLEDVFEGAVEAVGPEMRTSERVDQLGCDADATAGFAHRAFEDVAHAEAPLAATRALVRLLGRCPMKTANHRAAEEIEAAERMYVDETGGTLNLSPARRWP